MRHSGRSRRLLGGAAAIAVLAGSLAAFPALSTTLGTFWGKAAAASAMLQMPEGGMVYLQNRFQDDLVQDEPVSSSQPQAEKPVQSAAESVQEPSIPAESQAESQSQSTISIPQTPNLHPLRPSRRKTGERSRKRLYRRSKFLVYSAFRRVY